MGEAKRRGQQARQAGDALRCRIEAGEFGAERPVTDWLFVADRSPSGAELLRTLAGMSEFEGLRAMLAGEAFRLWEASALFRFVVLRGGPGTPERRTLLAADLARLTGEVLPRAGRALAGERWGAEVAVDADTDAAVRQVVGRLRG